MKQTHGNLKFYLIYLDLVFKAVMITSILLLVA